MFSKACTPFSARPSTLRRIGGCRSALAGLLNSRLECQHRWLLVVFEVDILLQTIDVLDALLDEPTGVTFLRRALANTRVAEQSLGLTLTHHQDWDPVPCVGITALRETEIGTDCRNARGLTGHQRMLSRECARLKAVRTPWRIVDVLLEGMPVNHCPCRNRRMRNAFRPRARAKC